MTLDECPFCHAPADWPQHQAYPRARCTCGGVGVWFGILADADEGADELLDELALPLLPAPTPVAVGTSGMITAVPYNGPATLAALAARLERHGYALTVVENRVMWARALTPPA